MINETLTFLPREQHAELFKGCVYLSNRGVVRYFKDNRRYVTLEPEQFREIYAGYAFPISSDNVIVTTDPLVALLCVRRPLDAKK